MAINYTKTNWVDGQAPAISASNLNKIESGIKDACDGVDTLSNDTGWLSGSTLTFGSGFQAVSDLYYRKVGNIVEIVGNVDSTTNHAKNSSWDIVQMPEGYRPANNFNDSEVVGVRYMATVAYGTSHAKSGWISYVADSTATDIASGDRVRLHLTYTV